MFKRIITNEISISLTVPKFSEAIYSLTDRNREFLREWLPWLDGIKSKSDTSKFIEHQLHRFAKGEALHVTIFYEDAVAGVAGYNTIDQANKIGYIGYWLGEEYNGKGIMTAAVRDLISVGEEFYSLQKVDIRCATYNKRSRAIPERLGFTHEGTLLRAEKVYDKWYNHEVYGYLLDYNSEQNAAKDTDKSAPLS
jgi:ribosomal-protein-serine acetyltransferase